MSIDKKTIEKLEKLSLLKLSLTEKTSLIPELEKIIGMVDKLSEVDTEGIVPLNNVNNHKQTLRKDLAQNTLSKEEALSNAKHSDENFFIVPKVISS